MYAELVFEAVQVPAVAGWQAIVQKVEWVGSVRVGGDTQTETSGMKETYIHTHARTHARTYPWRQPAAVALVEQAEKVSCKALLSSRAAEYL
jgi:hypothetical protein